MEERYNTNNTSHTWMITAPFFQGLSELGIEKALTHLVTRTHPANQVILLENDWGNSVYFIAVSYTHLTLPTTSRV